jgi:hypothetical protein
MCQIGMRYITLINGYYTFMVMLTIFSLWWTDKICQTQSHHFLANGPWCSHLQDYFLDNFLFQQKCSQGLAKLAGKRSPTGIDFQTMQKWIFDHLQAFGHILNL